MLAPLFALIAVTIRLRDGGGPALFRQARVGKNGRTFTVYKFRTMVIDAEERKAQLAGQQRDRRAAFQDPCGSADHQDRCLAAPLFAR